VKYPVPGLAAQAVSVGLIEQAAASRGGLSVVGESRSRPVPAVIGPEESPTRAGHRSVALCEVIADGHLARLITAIKAWAESLAVLHQRSNRFGPAPPARRPWVLEPDYPPAHLRSRLDEPGLAGVLAEIRSNPGLRGALDRVNQTWTGRHWIHGNATTANAVARAIGAYRWHVWLVGSESAGLGDPSWDLATAYDALLLHGQTRRIDMRPAVSAFLDAYRSCEGPGRLSHPMLITRALLTSVELACSHSNAAEQPAGIPLRGLAQQALRRASRLALTQAAPVPVAGLTTVPLAV